MEPYQNRESAKGYNMRTELKLFNDRLEVILIQVLFAHRKSLFSSCINSHRKSSSISQQRLDQIWYTNLQ